MLIVEIYNMREVYFLLENLSKFRTALEINV